VSTAAIRRFWSQVADLQCLICGSPAEIAHAHGPSLRERDPRFLKPKGKKPAWGDWLVIPLCPDHHFYMDNAPHDFARWYATPANLVDVVATRTGVDVWGNARALLRPIPHAAD
jgi:hypothetical protein